MVQADGCLDGPGMMAPMTLFSHYQLAMTKLDRLPMDVVTLIFCHFPLTEVLTKMPQISKKWRQICKNNQSNFWKRIFVFQSRNDKFNILGSVALNSQGDPLQLAQSIGIQNKRVLEALFKNEDCIFFFKYLLRKQFRHYKKQNDQVKRPHLKIKALEASSQDYNQSIFCTLNRFGATDNFWSSTGSETPDASEYLTYAIADASGTSFSTTNAPNVAFDLGKTAQFYSFTIAVFDPNRI